MEATVNLVTSRWQNYGYDAVAVDTTGDELSLTHGVYVAWADIAFSITLNDSTGAGKGASPSRWPSNTVTHFVIKKESGYAHFAALAGSGNVYVNRIADAL